MRRLAKIEAFIIEAQAQLRAVNALKEARKRREIHVAAKMIQDAYRPYRVYTTWKDSIRALGRIEEVKEARLSCQRTCSVRDLESYHSNINTRTLRTLNSNSTLEYTQVRGVTTPSIKPGHRSCWREYMFVLR